MEWLSEVITSCSFHPMSSNTILYTTTRGAVNICDLRVNHSIQSAEIVLDSEHLLESDSYFYELLLSWSDA